MLERKTALSSSLLVAARLLSRVIDLGLMLILARMLSPADFGLVAIAMTIVAILEAAFELPLSQALVSLPEIKPSYLDTAFTLGLIRGLVLCVLICSLAILPPSGPGAAHTGAQPGAGYPRAAQSETRGLCQGVELQI
jgi:O-antigen/teichoic acid export membrane protein